MNFSRDTVATAPLADEALIALGHDGSRTVYTFSEVSELSARVAGTFRRLGVETGDTVMTVIGNRAEWVFSLMGCFHIGAVALPCNEQLRTKDLKLRLEVAQPKLIVVDERNVAELERADPECKVLVIPSSELYAAEPVPAVDLSPEDPCLITFTSGTSGEPKAVLHGQRYLDGQLLQAQGWLGAGRNRRVWCTAASGWSKSARNAFIAPWLCGSTAIVSDTRFDPDGRLATVRRERVDVLCMSPTEYRTIAKRTQIGKLDTVSSLVAAGEPLNPEVIKVWQEATGLEIRDGYGQTETGQITGMPLGETVRPGSMGKPLPGVGVEIAENGELLIDPETVPTFFLRYLDEEPPRGLWHTGDRVRVDSDGYLYFEGRLDDVIISSGYRIGPFEVESALVSHTAVAEAAVVGAPDEERGSVVRAMVVLRDGHDPSEQLVKQLQDHVKQETAPYKYPRLLEFVGELPKTASGKIKRAELRTGFETSETVGGQA